MLVDEEHGLDMLMWRSGLSLVLLSLLASSLAAQSSGEANFQPLGIDRINLTNIDGGKEISIPRLQEGMVEIDGQPDEAAWQQAMLVDDFHQYEPVEYAPPSQHTEVRVFYTEEALYIATWMYETDPELISANVLRQGEGLRSDDLLAVILDPYLDRRNGYRFEVNANGIRWEGLFQNVSDIESNWDGIWQADASRDEQGWYGEMRIPFQTISFNPELDSWGINFRRAIRRNNESIAWISRNRQVNPSIAGTVSGLEGMRQGMGLDVVPSLTLRKDRIYGPVRFEEEHFEPQLDLFYKLTPQLNASLTLNTDFSAAEVDSRQVNLTRFNLFFPERRDFFIRDADIFEFGGIGSGGFSGGNGNPAVPGASVQNARPFFSRRIGLSPSGAPIDLNAGAKLSGRVGEWNVGSLLVNQAADDSIGLKESTVFVGRAARNVLGESQLGVIVTQGDPQSNQDSHLVGTDFRYLNSRLPGGRTVQGQAFYQESHRAGISGDNAAWGFGLSAPNNQGWRGSYNYKQVGENFDPALGFVNLRDMRDHALGFGYRHFFQPGGRARSLYGGFDGYRSESLADKQVISENIGLRLSGNNHSGDGMFLRVMRSRENLREDFVINQTPNGSRQVVIPAGDYRFNEYMTGVDFAEQRKLRGRISTRWGEFFDGNRWQRSVEVNWRPTARYDFGIDYTENEIHLSHGNFTVRLTSLTTRIAFSPTLSWSNLLQYDNVSEVVGFNSRLHWVPEAGRQAFVVLNYALADPERDNSFTSVSADLSLRFSYTFRF